MHTKANRQKKKLKKMDEVMKLQRQVAEIAEDNKKKVEALQAKFEKVEKEAYDECPVCYGSISVKNTCCMPNCDHKMCKNCYYNWLDKQEKNTCPMCREEVFKNNLDIKTKRSVLQHHLDSLESEVADMYHERRHIRKSVRDTQDELAQVDDDVNKLYNKHDQLRDEIFDKKQILDEIREYERHHDTWKKKRKQRLRKLIRTGKIVWRTNIKNVHKELFQKNFSWYEDELAVREEFKPCFHDEVDISETNMFELPPEFAGDQEMNDPHMLMHLDPWYRTAERDSRSAHRDKFEDSLHYIQNREIKYKSAINYGWWKQDGDVIWLNGYETDDTMPSLIDVTDQELQDIVLNETTFSQDELEYDRSASNVNPPLEEGEIVEQHGINRVNRRLNFGMGFNRSRNVIFDRLYHSSEFTEWERSYLSGNEDRSTGEVTGRSARV